MEDRKENLYQQELLRRANQGDTFTNYCGVCVRRIALGEAEAVLTVEKHHLNPYGLVHGGVYVTMMDQVAGCVSVSGGASAVTISSETRYMAAATGGTLTCHGKALRMGRHLAVVETKVLTDQNVTVAEGTYTFRFLQPGKKG